MPGEEDWIKYPLNIVQKTFEKFPEENWEERVNSYFKEKLDNCDVYQIPSLNCCPLNNLTPNSLVRVRGMIQDIFDPEYYISRFEMFDVQTQTKKKSFGRYKEIIDCNDENDLDFTTDVLKERMVYYCVPIPGENMWVKQMYSENCHHNGLKAQETSDSTLKRELDNEENSAEDDSNISCSNREISTDNVPNKKLKHSHDKNIPNESENADQTSGSDSLAVLETKNCIVKVYDGAEQFSLNDSFEFIGIYICDPHLAFMADLEDRLHSTILDEENTVHNPPSSAVHRIHVIQANKLSHNNPLLPLSSNIELDPIYSEVGVIRDRLLGVLEIALLGDALAAEYLLCHLLSTIYVRKDVLALGKFCLNLSGVPTNVDFVENLYKIIETVVPQSHFLPLTLTNTNTLQLIPKKEYSKNKLETGLLQMTRCTNLVLDETALSPGQLEAKGLQNMAALGNLILWQKVAYDFNFHSMEYPTEVSVLVVSEGKSLLPNDCHVPLRMTTAANSSKIDLINKHLSEQLTNEIRRYLSILKLTTFITNKDVLKDIEDDFVETRQTDAKKMTAEDFNWMLVLARFLSLSYGEVISEKTWARCKFLESSRKSRL